MTQAAKAQEPSMEEILASIRRIIADDENTKPAGAAASPVAAASSQPTPAARSDPAPGDEPEAASQQDLDIMLAGFEAAGREEDDPPQDKNDVLELTPSMEAKPPLRAPSFRTIEPTADVVFAETSDPDPEPYAAMPPPPPREESYRGLAHPGLMSHEATAAVTSAFGSLAHTVLAQNARTLDDLVREMLQPMLKGWLDDNLPTIVERLVRAEIERVSRGR